ncbi:MAG: SDR family oxidoreductase [Candidatus Sungiibacteriota bacterium]|uniref:SDR family oxidoreductase n=1 Tax=Candidatus Sungiibacteriota bacterium TaxID=2750080 RepID=A0A7T5RJP3_9BACT|nr:MAG: SDR family oxidoreductase [Candidatus Sungbacteria bacterium]
MSVWKKFSLDGAVAVITGGAGFLGGKHAEAILEGGGRVVLCDNHMVRLVVKTDELRSKYGQSSVWCYCLDITREPLIHVVHQKIREDVGEVSILINNVANNPQVEKGKQSLTRLENLSLEQWNDDFAVGVTGAFLMSRILGSRMAELGRGVIVNVLSDLGVIAPDQRIYREQGLSENQQPVKPVTYSVTKHALLGLTKYLATYWADRGVRVNAISPGGVYKEGMPEDFVKRLVSLIPMGRMANVNEYQAAILFLCSDASSYMTGANLIMDGGRTCW